MEHLLFSFITQNWRSKPLVSYLVIVQLITSTTRSWPLSASNPPLSTANGTTPSRRGAQMDDVVIQARP
jgi:hypothetical protein